MHGANTDKLRIMSRTENLRSVRNFVAAKARQFGFGEDEVQNIILAVDEACTNIIKHGYNGNPDKSIDIMIDASSNVFEVRIYDTGRTFDPSAVKPPAIQKHMKHHERGGYGLFLMKNLMDEVEFVFRPDVPNELRLRKYLSK
ncbi:MAG: ATP-binding protein [Bacteroidetes bacterium]|nr:ATP-binding protein [Bacteroidota bacterium]